MNICNNCLYAYDDVNAKCPYCSYQNPINEDERKVAVLVGALKSFKKQFPHNKWIVDQVNTALDKAGEK